MTDNYFTIIANINDGQDEVMLTPNAIMSIVYTFPSAVPKNIVEEGFEVSDTVVNKEVMIAVSAVISDSKEADTDNGFLNTTDFLNTLKSIRDSKTPFVVIGGKQGVEHNKHDTCLFQSYKQTQDMQYGVTQAGTATYKLDFTISAIRVADSATVTAISEEFIDALAELNSKDAQGVVSEYPDIEAEAIRIAISRDATARVTFTRTGDVATVGTGFERGSLPKDVIVIYENLLREDKIAATKEENRKARAKAVAERKAAKLQGAQDRVSFHTNRLNTHLRG